MRRSIDVVELFGCSRPSLLVVCVVIDSLPLVSLDRVVVLLLLVSDIEPLRLCEDSSLPTTTMPVVVDAVAELLPLVGVELEYIRTAAANELRFSS